MKTRWILIALLPIFVSGAAPAAAKWKCGTWKKDPKGKCEEVRTCTRSVCDATGKIENCRQETRTDCANPIATSPAPQGSGLVETGPARVTPEAPPTQGKDARLPSRMERNSSETLR